MEGSSVKRIALFHTFCSILKQVSCSTSGCTQGCSDPLPLGVFIIAAPATVTKTQHSFRTKVGLFSLKWCTLQCKIHMRPKFREAVSPIESYHFSPKGILQQKCRLGSGLSLRFLRAGSGNSSPTQIPEV